MHLISARLDTDDIFMNRTEIMLVPSELTFKERRQKINKKDSPAGLEVGRNGKTGLKMV